MGKEKKEQALEAKVETKGTASVESILAKYGFTTGRPKVQRPKNLSFARQALVRACIRSGGTPLEGKDRLTIQFDSPVANEVLFYNDKWALTIGKETTESHYGHGSIELIRWLLKNA